MKRAILAASWLGALCAAHAQPAVTAIEAGKVLTMDDADRVINDAVVLIEGGKITAIGRRGEVEVPAGARVIDAHDRWLMPGLIDCHNHVAGSLADLNDGVYLTNPGLRTVDTLTPNNELLKNARAGGVTTVMLIPGSGNNMGGFGTIARTAGDTVEAMTVRAPGSLKIAQAGNPERYWFGVGRTYMNWNLGQTLAKARAYHDSWTEYEAAKARGEGLAPPPRNLVWEDFRPLFRGEIPVTVHTQMYQVVQKTITQLHDTYGLRVVLDHSTFDGYRTSALVVERDLYTIVGPRQFYFDRTQRRIFGCAQRYFENGVRKLGFNTDAPVVPQEELSLQATIGCRLGFDPYLALKGLTIYPARALLIDGMVGSLEVGKAADFGVWTGDPLDPRHACLMTLVQGEVVYDARQDRRF